MPTVFRLAEFLERAKLSQGELSRLTGISRVTINRICQNHTAGIDLDTLDKIAAVLKCEPCDLIVREAGKAKVRR